MFNQKHSLVVYVLLHYVRMLINTSFICTVWRIFMTQLCWGATKKAKTALHACCTNAFLAFYHEDKHYRHSFGQVEFLIKAHQPIKAHAVQCILTDWGMIVLHRAFTMDTAYPLVDRCRRLPPQNRALNNRTEMDAGTPWVIIVPQLKYLI